MTVKAVASSSRALPGYKGCKNEIYARHVDICEKSKQKKRSNSEEKSVERIFECFGFPKEELIKALIPL